MNLIGITLISCFSIVSIIGSRNLAAISLLLGALYITQGQSLDLGLNLTGMRFVEIATFIRVISRGELARVRFTGLDYSLFWFFACLLLLNSIQSGKIDLYELGTIVDGLIIYCSSRALVTSTDDYLAFLKTSAVVLVPFALLMALEAISGRNVFAAMGGVPESPILRDGHYRCQGSFRVAITAGSLGATYFPLFVGLVFDRTRRRVAIVGCISCLAIVVASRSSGPLMAITAGALGWGCWLIRDRMRWVRRWIVIALIALHLTMSKPVWFIFDRLSGILGGDGWHRSNLIDKFIDHTGDWWLVGMPFINTSDWAATQLPGGGVDVTNYYVSIGLAAGLLPLFLFVFFLVKCFTAIGKTVATLELREGPSQGFAPALWGIGCTICAHALNLSAVLYWDQSYVFWYLHLGLAATMVAWHEFTSNEWISRHPMEFDSPVNPTSHTPRYS